MSYYAVPQFTVAASTHEEVKVEPTASKHTIQVAGTTVGLTITARLSGSLEFTPLGDAITEAGVYDVSAVGVASINFENTGAADITVTVAGCAL